MGIKASPEAFAQAGDDVLAGGQGYGHNDFKFPLVRRTLASVLTTATHSA